MDLAELSKRIEQGRYSVPAELVAEAMLPWITPTAPGAVSGEPPAPLPRPPS